MIKNHVFGDDTNSISYLSEDKGSNVINFDIYSDDTNGISCLSKDIIVRIKSFKYNNLTKEQESIINEIFPNEDLINRYKTYGLCEVCEQPCTSEAWCHFCITSYYKQNFKNWTSGNKTIDEFIQKNQLKATRHEEVLEWIPYEKLFNIKYIAEGGFGVVCKADWFEERSESKYDRFNKMILNHLFPTHPSIRWFPTHQTSIPTNEEAISRFGRVEIIYRENNLIFRKTINVILKDLNNSRTISEDFLREISYHNRLSQIPNSNIVRCYGISKDPKTNHFIMVMQYVKNGSIRQYLDSHFNELVLIRRLDMLRQIAIGLKAIHHKGFVHKDLHPGNILKDELADCYITDLGLCRPANEQSEIQDNKKNIYGILPYVAPEVLRGKVYTKASDIYSFGIIAYEVISGLPPYHDLAHDELLAIKICEGLRPKFRIKIPQVLEHLINQCLDADPSKRIKVEELELTLSQWVDDIRQRRDTDAYKQFLIVMEKQLLPLPAQSCTSSNKYATHSQAFYTSRLLDFNDLPEPQNSKEVNDQFYNLSTTDSLECLRINLPER